MRILNIFKPKSVKRAIDSSNQSINQHQGLPSAIVAQQLARDVNPQANQQAPQAQQADSHNLSQTLQTCRDFCSKLMTEAGDRLEHVQSRWQKFYSGLNDAQKRAVWHYAERQLPHVDENKHDRSLINSLWQRIFSNESIIRRITKGALTAEKGYGLVYCYFINGKIRYIGKTKDTSFFKRFVPKQIDKLGYKDSIKRNLINAYRMGQLYIEVQPIELKALDKYQKDLIEQYAPTNRLWNEKDNKHFNAENYNFSF